MNGKRMKFGFALTLAVLSTAPAEAEQFAVLTYNVRGLPPQVIEDRTAEIAAIAPLLEDFHTAGGLIDGIDSIVLLQELFYQSYYDTLTDTGTITYPTVTLKDSSGPSGIGDGLNMLTDFTFTGFDRTQWTDCFGSFGQAGSDCDTNKGYSFARYTVAGGFLVDVYNLHADAGQDTDSQLARRNNIDQLITAINTRSPEGTAVIVMGDTNSLYTRSPDDTIESMEIGAGVTDVWVELKNGGVTPGPGAEINSGCDSDPSGPDCEMIDKVFYRSGDGVILTPIEYIALKDEFSNGSGDLSDHVPVSVLFNVSAGGSTTTSSTTTTTIGSGGSCADPVAFMAGDVPNEDAVSASDALFVLRAAVGIDTCALCLCDPDNSGSVAATDALLTLKAAVGQPVTLNCPACN